MSRLGNAGSIQFTDENGNLIIDGSDIATAKPQILQSNFGTEYIVELTLNQSGKIKFGKATKENIGKIISIIYDGEVIHSPKVEDEITMGQAQISGQESFEEAEKLASSIRIGALPLELKEIRSNVVGAKLGSQAVTTSLTAGFLGFILVMIFMIAYYRLPGLASAISLVIYLGLMLFLLNILNITLTLPGIAGIILSIGMAVDANVIIFTRIKEEIMSGKPVPSSIKIGFEKALSAILDGNITTLIAAAVLWINGTGTVKGFAGTLALGIILSMFTALFVTQFIIRAFLYIGLNDNKLYGNQKIRKTFNFIKNGPKFYLLSFLIISIGIVAIFYNKSTIGQAFHYGLDFKGGTSTNITFKDRVPTNKEIEEFVFDITKDSNIEVAAIKNSKSVIIRTNELSLSHRTEMANKFVKDFNADAQKITAESISGIVSREMKVDAMIAIAIAILCMLVYIWFRFKDLNFGLSAVLALLHDVLIVIMVYAVTRIPVGNTFIACVLTIVGYSINSTIVIFDRIRENMKAGMNKQSLEDIVNTSITQTLRRSIHTSFTTLITVFLLYVLGVESIKDFAFPLMTGIVFGAYSSICIAGTLWYLLKTRFIKKKIR